MSKKLNELYNSDSLQNVAYLSEDNRDIKEDTLFFCLKGANFDAHTVVDDVIKKGAKVIVHTDDIINKQEGIVYLKVTDIEDAMALISKNFYDDPSSKLNLIGLTGTNGKTTTAWILYDLLNRLDSCGYIGTIDIEYNNKIFNNLFTTPKPIELNYHLNEMVNDKINNCALEISSHALVQKRAAYSHIKYAIMTNLTFEHINFHGSMEEYGKAKRILFEGLTKNSYAILNIDDSTYEDYKVNTKANVISYGVNNNADIMAKDIEIGVDKTCFTLVIKEDEYQVETNLVALFNVYNLLAALSVIYLEGYNIKDIIPLLKNISNPQGRMETINEQQDFDVIVDYAHTPDGFIKVFEYAKTIAKGDVIALFGSAGGDRDREKRPVLGEIASKYCDRIILTQEDNREESVEKISKEISKGITIDNVDYIDKREDAVAYALEIAKPNDMVLLLAKANDKYNVVGNKAVSYEGDIDLSRRLLKERFEKSAK